MFRSTGRPPAEDLTYRTAVNKYGEEEVAAVKSVIESGHLFSSSGTGVRRLERRLRDQFGVVGCTLVSSGTAAVHTALAAVGIDFGDEVATTPISDVGTIIPILLLGAVPVFADVDEDSMMITVDTIRPVVSPRTKAILIVHYGGYPADLRSISAFAAERGLAVIEDCAQAQLARHHGQLVGTFGDAAAFSANETKHASCGDGGFVLARTPAVAERARLFHDKGLDRESGLRDPVLLGPNYRMTELQAAVLDKQWDKLATRVAGRQKFAQRCDTVIDGIPWLRSVRPRSTDEASYFSYLIRVGEEAPVSIADLCSALRAVGLRAHIGNLYDVLYRLRLFHSARPRYFQLLPAREYGDGLCPRAEELQASMIRVEMLDTYGEREEEGLSTLINQFNA